LDDLPIPGERISGSRSGGQRKPGPQGRIGNNQAENQLFRAVVKRAGLNKDQQQRLHREISGQGITDFQAILKIAEDIKNGLL